jgi:phosphatidylglycerol---prolipoprotein diacylglyceryl transferase
MIDPVIFSFKLFGFELVLRWYGLLVMLGAVAGALWAEREIKRRGENGESIWDAMLWVLPAGIIGARLWYVLNSIFSGSTYYTEYPVRILYITEGGLHFFGGLLFGAIALYMFLNRSGKDIWLYLDAIAPATLLGQAIARPANFINQELYGPPTTLPWGISIDAVHRLSEFPASLYPVATTRFHPTFAYEMILNLLIVLFLFWLSRRYVDALKPGALFSAWLLLAGLSRTFIEFFRPDQPRIGESFVSYTMLVSFLMAIGGAVMLLVRYGKLQLAIAKGWEDKYQIGKPTAKPHARVKVVETVETVEDEPPAKKPVKSKSTLKKPAGKAPAKKSPANKLTAKKTATKKAPAKKTSTRRKSGEG